ncbi:MAG: toll/interleukin-1 receptor domain-containing protein [Gammaproteobacteria bacterium]|nr:toll/interleukin-1 receptor domain-containing protein [Gammaproteobacteria bacterium]
MKPNEIPYGPVKIIDGYLKDRIGYYDDEDTIFDEEIDCLEISDEEVCGIPGAVIYIGDFFLAEGYYIIPQDFIAPVTMEDLMARREKLHDFCGRFSEVRNPEVDLDEEDKLDYFRELHYVDSVLVDRMIEVRYSNKKSGDNIFISHSSKDKNFAKWLATDLKAAGHTPWLDEWSIKVGESIPQKISEGVKDATFVIVILSEYSVASHWVEREWQTKYWDEVEKGKIQVLPVMYQDCKIPELLKSKRYADFRNNYNNGLEDILHAIDVL